jgi:hypothetical protein
MIKLRFAFVTLIALSTIPAQAAGPVVFGGASVSLAPSSSSWAWDGSYIAAYRNALTNPANFGPSGIVKTTINTVTLTTITPATLSGLNVFVAPWWYNTESAPYNQMIVNFFLAGGNLILLDDGSAQSGIATLLGIPTIDNSTGSVSNGPPPLFNGPFGVATNVTQTAEIGYLSASNVTSHGGVACSTNADGQITAACWAKGAYAAGAGAMIITGDVDMISTYGSATYSPLDSNGIFALNGAAYIAGQSSTTTPSTVPAMTPTALVALMILMCGIGAVLLKKAPHTQAN